jgi:isoquinoline 1-oxidoreductase beta subunit
METTRRGFLSGMFATTGVLSLVVTVGCGGHQGAARVRHAETTGELAANLFITILPDGRVALAVDKAEMGQGIATGYATLAAEELDVPLDHVEVHLADSLPEYRISQNMHATGASSSLKDGYLAVRTAAAAAREMLVGAAAATWGVPAHECTVVSGRVLHPSSRRSTGYGELTKDAARREVPSRPQLKASAAFALIGKPGRRVDARGKVDGTAIYGIDVVVPDMVNAVMLHAPVFGARARRVHDAKARRHAGVIDVFPVRGGVAIVAQKYWQALAASRDVAVEWGEGDVAGLDTEAMRVAMRDHQGESTTTRDDGDTRRALAAAATTVDALYEAPFLAHGAMEPQNTTVAIRGRRAEVWSPCQSPTIVQTLVGHELGIDRDDVLVHTTFSGGAFGRRTIADFAVEAAAIAKRIELPVKLVWSRASDLTQAYYRPQSTARVRGGLTADGKVSAVDVHVLSQPLILSMGDLFGTLMADLPGPLVRRLVSSLMAMFSSSSIGDLFSTEGIKDSPYRVPSFRAGFTPVRTKLPIGLWRSVGHSFTGFVMESFVDELALAAGQDPMAFRRTLLPPRSREVRVLDAVAKLSNWGSPLRGGLARGLARHRSFDTEVAQVAEVEIVDDRIKVRRVHCVVDCGVAVNPDIVRAQMEGAIIFGLSAALDQEITLVDGVVQQRNYDTFPLLRMFEAPEIVVEIIQSDEPPTGVGEPGLPPIAAAVANAVASATGVRLRRLPLQRAWSARAAG